MRQFSTEYRVALWPVARLSPPQSVSSENSVVRISRNYDGVGYSQFVTIRSKSLWQKSGGPRPRAI
jgi:hypothetical protein